MRTARESSSYLLRFAVFFFCFFPLFVFSLLIAVDIRQTDFTVQFISLQRFLLHLRFDIWLAQIFCDIVLFTIHLLRRSVSQWNCVLILQNISLQNISKCICCIGRHSNWTKLTELQFIIRTRRVCLCQIRIHINPHHSHLSIAIYSEDNEFIVSHTQLTAENSWVQQSEIHCHWI